jgi:lysozyme
MRTSPAGIDAIKGFEQCVLKTYRCKAGKLTIGWGHTGADVTEGLTWTLEQAEAALRQDLVRFENIVSATIKRPLSQGQFDALVCLSFNIGTDAFRTSTLAKRFNAGNVQAAGAEFVRWNKVKGRVDPDLLRRRALELWMFARAS